MNLTVHENIEFLVNYVREETGGEIRRREEEEEEALNILEFERAVDLALQAREERRTG